MFSVHFVSVFSDLNLDSVHWDKNKDKNSLNRLISTTSESSYYKSSFGPLVL